jgi:ADP-heptose:LPS heptosyltransferase
MGLKGKLAKVLRWVNIWSVQFKASGLDNKRSSDDTGKVLVIKVDAIGDFIIWLDSAKELRKCFPDKQIVLMCSGACVDIAKHTGYFDEIITLNIRKFESDNNYRRSEEQKLSKLSFDVLVQTAYSRTVHMDMLAACIPARVKIGLVSDETRTNLSRYIAFKSNTKKLDAVYDRLIPTSKEWLMEVKRNAELIRGLGISDFKTHMPQLAVYECGEGVVPRQEYYVIFPGASTPKKMWDIEKFAKVADYVCREEKLTGYVCGSSDEQWLFDKLRKAALPDTMLCNYMGRTSLLELGEVIRNAKFVISNDTSGIHYAAATDVPAVCILGEYNYGRFLPYDCDENQNKSKMIICNANMPCARCAVGRMTAECNKCMAATGRYLCVDRIPEEMVIKAISDIMKES